MLFGSRLTGAHPPEGTVNRTFGVSASVTATTVGSGHLKTLEIGEKG